MMRADRKGALGAQVFGIFEFLLFILIIGASIAFGTYLFYGKGYDFRNAEADLLNYKITSCIMENEINMDFYNEFFEKCGLNREIVNKTSIIKICRNSGDCIEENKNENILFQSGSNFVACEIAYKKKSNAPGCVSKSFSKNGERFEIIVGSKQSSRREFG